MPYVNPGWVNGGVPAIDQDNLNDISNTLETVPVANGGTGATSITSGAIVEGNGTSAVQELLGTGAVYATTSGSPQFGTLPVSCGGTGVTTLAQLKSDMGLSTAGWVAQGTAPGDTSVLWIDTANGNQLKFYDSGSSAWVSVAGSFA